MKINYAAWMIETAYKYYKASEVLLGHKNLDRISQVNAALSIEILFKSFFVEASSHHGEVFENYRFNKSLASKVKFGKDSHDLWLLADSLPQDIKVKLISREAEGILKRYRDSFTIDRYIYEGNSKQGYSAQLTQLAGVLVGKVIQLYKDGNCNDPWIQAYPNI